MRGLLALMLLAAHGHGAEHNPSGAPAAWHAHDMGAQRFGMLLIDRLEYGAGDEDSHLWDVQGWYGGDYQRVAFKSEGEGEAGETLETVELQALYQRTVSAFWSAQAGVRHDFRPGEPDVTYATVGVQGLAPQWFETDLALFLSDAGDLSLRGEFEYDLLLSQRLVLQPRLEVNASLSDAPSLGVGRGLHGMEAGLRLRYEIRRQLAPYLGVRWERRFGETRDLARAAGDHVSGTWLVLGIRAWW